MQEGAAGASDDSANDAASRGVPAPGGQEPGARSQAAVGRGPWAVGIASPCGNPHLAPSARGGRLQQRFALHAATNARYRPRLHGRSGMGANDRVQLPPHS